MNKRVLFRTEQNGYMLIGEEIWDAKDYHGLLSLSGVSTWPVREMNISIVV